MWRTCQIAIRVPSLCDKYFLSISIWNISVFIILSVTNLFVIRWMICINTVYNISLTYANLKFWKSWNILKFQRLQILTKDYAWIVYLQYKAYSIYFRPFYENLVEIILDYPKTYSICQLIVHFTIHYDSIHHINIEHTRSVFQDLLKSVIML